MTMLVASYLLQFVRVSLLKSSVYIFPVVVRSSRNTKALSPVPFIFVNSICFQWNNDLTGKSKVLYHIVFRPYVSKMFLEKT